MLGLNKLGKLGGLIRALKPIAPVAATALETFAPVPGSPIVAAVIRKVAGVAGGDPADPPSVEAALTNLDTAGLAALRQTDDEIAADLERARISDRQDARARHSGQRGMLPLAWAGSLMFAATAIGSLWLAALHATPETMTNIMFAVLGHTSGIAASVFAFYFGSSQREHTRDDKD